MERYARIQKLESTVEALATLSAGECEDWILERAQWEYGRDLDAYSRTFSDDSQAALAWSRKAAAAYESYIGWFIGLDHESQDLLIQSTSQRSRASAQFPEYRVRWILSRVGNAVVGLGAASVRAHDHKNLLVRYARIGDSAVEIFPEEAVKEWHRWLRAMPDFQRLHTSQEILQMVEKDPESADQWSEFRDFLSRYVQANPSIRDRWSPISKRISKWLPL